jgi:outer membrane lipoprotein-sorting protein
MKRVSKTVLALLGALAITGTVVGESTPDALQWLGRMADVYSGGPFTLNYDVDMNLTDMGQTLPMKMHGRSTQSGRTHFRIETAIEMTMPGAESSVQVEMLSISDGEVMWVQMNNPMGGGLQVLKMPLDKLEQIAATNPMARNFTRMDPVAQVEELARLFDFEITDTSEGAVTLEATMAGEGLERAKEFFSGLESAQLSRFVLVIDTETHFPREIRVGGESPTMIMRFSDVERLSEMDADLFVYAVPEGATVLDLGALIEDAAQDRPEGEATP